MPKDCTHPYFAPTEDLSIFFTPIVFYMGALLIVVGAALWIWTRWAGCAFILAGGVFVLLVRFGLSLDPESAFRKQLGTEDLARLQRELQLREADLAQYGREHPGLSNKDIVDGFVSTYRRSGRFEFSDPTVPPVFLEFSHWRDNIPRVVVSFGCNNHMLFDSTTMRIQQID